MCDAYKSRADWQLLTGSAAGGAGSTIVEGAGAGAPSPGDRIAAVSLPRAAHPPLLLPPAAPLASWPRMPSTRCCESGAWGPRFSQQLARSQPGCGTWTAQSARGVRWPGASGRQQAVKTTVTNLRPLLTSTSAALRSSRCRRSRSCATRSIGAPGAARLGAAASPAASSACAEDREVDVHGAQAALQTAPGSQCAICTHHSAHAQQYIGVNSRRVVHQAAHLKAVECRLQRRLRASTSGQLRLILGEVPVDDVHQACTTMMQGVQRHGGSRGLGSARRSPGRVPAGG